MKTINKIIALGAVGAAGVAGTVAIVRAIRARRAEQQFEVSDIDEIGDTNDVEDEPVIVSEEVIIVTEANPYEADMEEIPGGGFTPGSR
jgi:hypothetical protein